jgi:hypothetical protein
MIFLSEGLYASTVVVPIKTSATRANPSRHKAAPTKSTFLEMRVLIGTFVTGRYAAATSMVLKIRETSVTKSWYARLSRVSLVRG